MYFIPLGVTLIKGESTRQVTGMNIIISCHVMRCYKRRKNLEIITTYNPNIYIVRLTSGAVVVVNVW